MHGTNNNSNNGVLHGAALNPVLQKVSLTLCIGMIGVTMARQSVFHDSFLTIGTHGKIC